MIPIVVIPARGGSKGVLGKNIKPLAGKPLIYYTIEVARQVFPDEQIIVTTDDEAIKTCVEMTGLKVPFIRPPDLAADSSGMHEVLLHAVKFAESRGLFPDTLILLQTTTPFRTSTHLKEAMQLYDKTTEMVVSVKETKSNPYYLLFEENKEGWLEKSKKGSFPTRQLCPKVWEFNGGIFIINVDNLKLKPLYDFTKVRKYVMDDFSSHDIDTILDWEIAETLIKQKYLLRD